MKEIFNRLKECRVNLGLNQGEIADKIGYTQKDVSLIEHGKKKFIPNEYILFLRKNNININWIFTGIGTMYMNKQGSGGENNLPVLVTVDPLGKSNIVMVNVPAQAGYLDHNMNPDFIEQLPAFTLPNFTDREYRAFEISGDSMQYSIKNGDWVISERLESPLQIQQGGIYVIVSIGSLLCKRIVNKIKEEGHLVLKSDNDTYEDQYLAPEEVREIWAVKAVLSRDFTHAHETISRLNNEVIRLEKIIEKITSI